VYSRAVDAGPRQPLIMALVALWALRLAIYIGARNWGEPEDRRYQAIRKRNDPGFTFKSLYLVFVLQAVLAAIVSQPLLGAIAGQAPLGWLDALGVVVIAVGLFFETVGDWQLSRFKADPANSHGPGALGPDASSELLRRFLRLVGFLSVSSGGRRMVDHLRSAVDFLSAAQGVWRQAARKRHWPAPSGLCGIHPPHQRVLPGSEARVR
jgi:hypothetical protein